MREKEASGRGTGRAYNESKAKQSKGKDTSNRSKTRGLWPFASLRLASVSFFLCFSRRLVSSCYLPSSMTQRLSDAPTPVSLLLHRHATDIHTHTHTYTHAHTHHQQQQRTQYSEHEGRPPPPPRTKDTSVKVAYMYRERGSQCGGGSDGGGGLFCSAAGYYLPRSVSFPSFSLLLLLLLLLVLLLVLLLLDRSNPPSSCSPALFVYANCGCPSSRLHTCILLDKWLLLARSGYLHLYRINLSARRPELFDSFIIIYTPAASTSAAPCGLVGGVVGQVGGKR
jgi:hypothetical protein